MGKHGSQELRGGSDPLWGHWTAGQRPLDVDKSSSRPSWGQRPAEGRTGVRECRQHGWTAPSRSWALKINREMGGPEREGCGERAGLLVIVLAFNMPSTMENRCRFLKNLEIEIAL